MLSTNGLTSRQTEILAFIAEFQRNNGIPPTYREIARHFGFKGPKAAMDHVRALERKGFVKRRKWRSRGIELIKFFECPDDNLVGSVEPVPVLGNISAGLPQEETENCLETIAVDRAMFGISRGSRLFALKVKGESMRGREIRDGDWVVADADARPVQGDVVVALIDGENVLKTFSIKDGSCFLKAENPEFPDLVPLDEMTIQGVVKALFRRMP